MKQILLLMLVMMIVPFSSAQAQKAPSAAEQAILKMEQEWEDALLKSDVAALERIYAVNMNYTHSSGTTDDKATYIGNIKSGATKYESMKRDEVKVYLYGNTATVFCHWQVNSVSRGNKIATNAKLLHVYVKQNGRWQMVNHQATRIAQ